MEALFMAIQRSDPDPVVDAQLYKRGDIVVVRPDGWPWGKEENPATAQVRHFYLVKIPGLTLTEARQEALALTEFDEEGKVTLRRLWRALIDDIPATIKQKLLETGTVTVTPAQIRNYIRNKRTNEPL